MKSVSVYWAESRDNGHFGRLCVKKIKSLRLSMNHSSTLRVCDSVKLILIWFNYRLTFIYTS